MSRFTFVHVFLIFTIIITFTSCKTLKKLNKTYSNKTIIIKSQKDLDNENIKLMDYDSIFFEAGLYNINNTIFLGSLKKNLFIQGIGNVIFNTATAIMDVYSENLLEFQYIGEIKRGTDKISIPNEINFKLEDNNDYFLKISTKTNIENNWKYDKGELIPINKISKNSILLKDSVFFDYFNNDKIVFSIYKPQTVEINNIVFKTNKQNNWDYKALIYSNSVNLKVNNLNIENNLKEQKGKFIICTYCNDSQFKNLQFKNLTYGITLSYGYNSLFDSIIGNNVIHPIVPAVFSKNIYVTNFKGNNTAIDAHLAINVSYENIDINTGLTYFNCRAFGVKLKNVVIRCYRNASGDSVYLGIPSLFKEYEHYRNDYDIILENVDWQHKLIGYNGLHVQKCRDFIVNNCTTHSVSTGSFIRNFIINNSDIGYFKCYDSNFKITNTNFDGRLQNNQNTIPPINCSFSGEATITDCKFLNYNTALIGFISSPNTKLTFKNCKLNSINSFCDDFQYPDRKYNQIQFENCTLPNITVIPTQFSERQTYFLNILDTKKKK